MIDVAMKSLRPRLVPFEPQTKDADYIIVGEAVTALKEGVNLPTPEQIQTEISRLESTNQAREQARSTRRAALRAWADGNTQLTATIARQIVREILGD